MAIGTYQITVLNTSGTETMDVKLEVDRVKFVEFFLSPSEMGTTDNLSLDIGTQDLVISQRLYGTHTWHPLEGSPVVVQVIGEGSKYVIGGSGSTTLREAIITDKMNITNIEYNEDYDDYDVTCTTCGMCFICSSESDAQNVLFNHLREEHSKDNLK